MRDAFGRGNPQALSYPPAGSMQEPAPPETLGETPADEPVEPPARPTGLHAPTVTHTGPSRSRGTTHRTTASSPTRSYRRERDGANYGDGQGAREFVEIATTADAAVTYVDTSVAAGRRYVYRVVAVNAAGDSPRSSYANVGRHSWRDGQEALR